MPIPPWAISLILTLLQKSGFDAWAEKLAIKVGWIVIKDIEGLKTYSAPTDFPDVPPQEKIDSNVNK